MDRQGSTCGSALKLEKSMVFEGADLEVQFPSMNLHNGKGHENKRHEFGV